MEHNFRALKADPKQISSGNKYLRDFAGICKEYNKTLKKPVLVIKLNSNDFDWSSLPTSIHPPAIAKLFLLWVICYDLVNNNKTDVKEVRR
jgi:hypothetical protein